MPDASKPFSVVGTYLTLDLDLYDTDSDEDPDPGLLEENGELARPSLRRDFSREPKAPGPPLTHGASRRTPAARQLLGRGPGPHSDGGDVTALPLRPAELSFSKLVPHVFMRNSWRRSTTPRTRARQLWLLLRRSLHSFLEKVSAWKLVSWPGGSPGSPAGSQPILWAPLGGAPSLPTPQVD